MRIGIVTAMVEETVPIITKLGGVVAEDNIAGVRIVQIEAGGHTVYLANSGIGEIRAALAVQLLVDLFDIEVVLNFGFVGSLTGSLLVGETVIAGRAVHHQFDLSAVDGTPAGEYDGRGTVFFENDREIADRLLAALPSPLRVVTVASGDKFVGDRETKKRLRDEFGADICEMELAGICLAAERNGIPVFSLKVVSPSMKNCSPSCSARSPEFPALRARPWSEARGDPSKNERARLREEERLTRIEQKREKPRKSAVFDFFRDLSGSNVFYVPLRVFGKSYAESLEHALLFGYLADGFAGDSRRQHAGRDIAHHHAPRRDHGARIAAYLDGFCVFQIVKTVRMLVGAALFGQHGMTGGRHHYAGTEQHIVPYGYRRDIQKLTVEIHVEIVAESHIVAVLRPDGRLEKCVFPSVWEKFFDYPGAAVGGVVKLPRAHLLSFGHNFSFCRERLSRRRCRGTVTLRFTAASAACFRSPATQSAAACVLRAVLIAAQKRGALSRSPHRKRGALPQARRKYAKQPLRSPHRKRGVFPGVASSSRSRASLRPQRKAAPFRRR